MIPEQMSREELIEFVESHCALCIKSCPPFVKGEYYEVDQLDEYSSCVWDTTPGVSGFAAIRFIDDEMKEHFRQEH